MNKEQTIKYLRETLRLETDLITQRKSMNWMKNRINNLSSPTISRRSDIVREVIPQPDYASSGFFSLVIIISSFIELLLLQSLISYGFNGLPFFVMCVFLGFILLSALHIKTINKNNKDLQEEYDAAEERAERDYQNALAEERSRVERIIDVSRQEKESLSTDLAILKQQNAETTAALKQLYDLDIIYPKYRNISAISMFIQYLESGMCSEFGGPNGCYMIYEQELRTGAIVSSIDEMSKAVVNSIGEMSYNISRSQYELYNAISESNSQIKRLCTTTDDIKRHQAVLEAQNEQQLNTTRALGEYVVYRDLLS